MVATFGLSQRQIEAIEAAARDLVSLNQRADCYYLSGPLIYPDGSSVTDQIAGGAKGILVSDAGFTYRQIEDIGAERSFTRIAKRIAEEENVECGSRIIYADASSEEVHRAICDVSTASWRIAHDVYSRISEQDEVEIAEHLRDRLSKIFGSSHLSSENSIVGSSSSSWEVSAVVEINSAKAVFHAVANYPVSVFRTATAFHDIGSLENPPKLVAVVRNRTEMGPRLSLLSQAGRVIETQQPDAVFLRAAA